MNRKCVPALLVALSIGLLALSGCATKPMTPQQQAFKSAQSECTNLADSMIGPESYGGGDSIIWNSYFVTCMEGKGYTKDDLNKIWY